MCDPRIEFSPSEKISGDVRHSLADIGEHWLREIETFFDTYKLLEPKQTEILGWHDLDETRRTIAACQERYRSARGTA